MSVVCSQHVLRDLERIAKKSGGEEVVGFVRGWIDYSSATVFAYRVELPAVCHVSVTKAE